MSTRAASDFLWHDGTLLAADEFDPEDVTITAADSWLVADGSALAIDLHRDRFFDAVASSRGTGSIPTPDELAAFWASAVDVIPRTGEWFPRVEWQQHRGMDRLVFRHRPAPPLRRSLTLATHAGADPRMHPTVKGPDTSALLRAKTTAQERGADEAVITSAEGFVVDGTTTAILWWRGDVLCVPSPELQRVDSVTARCILALAGAIGTDVYHESARPDDLDGREIWAVNSLHGIRIASAWVGGPQLAEEPGRLADWRARLDRLTKPLD